MSLGLLALKGVAVCAEAQRALRKSRPKVGTKAHGARSAATYFLKDTENLFEHVVCQGVSEETMPLLKEALNRLYASEDMMELARVKYSPIREMYPTMVSALSAIKFDRHTSIEVELPFVRRLVNNFMKDVVGLEH